MAGILVAGTLVTCILFSRLATIVHSCLLCAVSPVMYDMPATPLATSLALYANLQPPSCL